jgi:hypothetical protein
MVSMLGVPFVTFVDPGLWVVSRVLSPVSVVSTVDGVVVSLFTGLVWGSIVSVTTVLLGTRVGGTVSVTKVVPGTRVWGRVSVAVLFLPEVVSGELCSSVLGVPFVTFVGRGLCVVMGGIGVLSRVLSPVSVVTSVVTVGARVVGTAQSMNDTMCFLTQAIFPPTVTLS